MNIRKIIAIVIIYILGWAGWWILGTVTALRSDTFSYRLAPQVESLWGTDLVQPAPRFSVKVPGTELVRHLMPYKNDINVSLISGPRKKGLLWYSTYDTVFDADYTIRNELQVAQKIYIHYDFPAKGATYDEFSMHLNDEKLTSPVDTRKGVDEIIELPPGEDVVFSIRYITRGMNTWRYLMSENTGRVRNFTLTAETNFRDIDFTPDSLSPHKKEKTDKGMRLEWKSTDQITDSNIGIIIPDKINPGPLTTRITYFAPVCLLFFFVLTATIGIMYSIRIHPMHYLFVTAGFFAFHLMLSYMAGHVWIHLAFFISAAISVGLVTFYLRTALGQVFPWKVAVAGQLFFLVLFSYTFFIKGITGLIVATGSVVTLGILMKVTADVDWEMVFSKTEQPLPPPVPETMGASGE